MKTVYIKSTPSGTSLSQPCQEGIVSSDLFIYKIEEVPASVEFVSVKNLFDNTVIVGTNRFVFKYDELGNGKIISTLNGNLQR